MSMAPPDILQRIVARKRDEVAARKREQPLEGLREVAATAPPTRGFAAALRARLAAGEAAVIAEIKRASPSRGLLREDFEPSAIAASYAAAGAACLSVLTDVEFFRGADQHLRDARAACRLPVLRKDFTIDPYQVYEARALGADCILLIAACLDDETLIGLATLARELGLDVLVEVHDAAELGRALVPELAHTLLGINNRDLRTFEVSLRTTVELARQVPATRLPVSESGILNAADVAQVRAAGVHAFLVGEAFMRAPDPGAALRALFAPPG